MAMEFVDQWAKPRVLSQYVVCRTLNKAKGLEPKMAMHVVEHSTTPRVLNTNGDAICGTINKAKGLELKRLWFCGTLNKAKGLEPTMAIDFVEG